MKLTPGQIYHIYNQGNNHEKLFYSDDDYQKFLQLFQSLVYPHCKVLCYCLMPNHFHFLIYATEESVLPKKVGNLISTPLANGFRLLQSGYAQYLNQKNGRSGSLFRQKARAKCINEGCGNYSFIAFRYIHQNPFTAGLVARIELWKYSSFHEFIDPGNQKFCDTALAEQLTGFNKNRFLEEIYSGLDEDMIKHIF